MKRIKLNRSFAIGILAPAALFLAACSGSSAGVNLPAPVAQATVTLATATTAPTLAGPTVAATAAPTSAVTVAATTMATATVATSVTVAATAASTTAATAAPTPAASVNPPATCTPGTLTPALTEGPYYKANPPENSTLAGPSAQGTLLTITGYVFDANCKPLAGARVDFWQADAQGQYDNSGYTLRGYQLTDAQGRYSVQTVVPGRYPGRTRHIHVRVTAPGGATLTTQLFFPNEPQNSSDSIFAAQNVLDVQKSAGGGESATFNFVVNGK
jgi:protocatechuate 3,4-dioxygenase beta subunit